jgi:uncharacterized integral membrane protein
MANLVVHVLFLIVLAVLIGLNVSHQTTINLFGTELQNISVIVVILLSFVIGVLYALLAVAANSVIRRRRGKQQDRAMQNREREKKLNEREKDLEDIDRVRGAKRQEDQHSGGTGGPPT